MPWTLLKSCYHWHSKIACLHELSQPAAYQLSISSPVPVPYKDLSNIPHSLSAVAAVMPPTLQPCDSKQYCSAQCFFFPSQTLHQLAATHIVKHIFRKPSSHFSSHCAVHKGNCSSKVLQNVDFITFEASNPQKEAIYTTEEVLRGIRRAHAIYTIIAVKTNCTIKHSRNVQKPSIVPSQIPAWKSLSPRTVD